MRLRDFEIGCTIRYSSWDTDYTVLDINEQRGLYLENNTTNERFWWSGYEYLVLEVTGVDASGKTPIERKIAHLYKLFEERKMK